MAIVYETGISTGASDLLTKLKTFAVSTAGWTLVRDNGAGSTGSGYPSPRPRGDGTSNQVSLTDASAAEDNQFNFFYDNTAAYAHLMMQPSVGDSGAGAEFFEHDGTPNDTGTAQYVSCGQMMSTADQGFSGSHKAYHFFGDALTDGRYIHVVVEGTTGVFWHMSFGTIIKAGDLNGGQYMVGHQQPSSSPATDIWPYQQDEGNLAGHSWIRFDDGYTANSVTTDGGTSRWFQGFGDASLNGGGTDVFTFGLYQYGPQYGWNSRTSMAPVVAFARNRPQSAAQGTYPMLNGFMILGTVPNVRQISVESFDDGESLTIGSDEWLVFPMHVKNPDTVEASNGRWSDKLDSAGPAPNGSSGYMGLAYRKS